MTGFVHIGAPKCGSTTIQSLVERNAEDIRASGVVVPEDPNFGNQIAHRYVNGWLSADQINQTGAYDAFLQEHRKDDIFLSSEAYLALAGNPDNLTALLKLIGQEKLHVLGVIRNPVDLLESTWFQWMRTYRTFPKVHAAMNEWGLYYKNFISSQWFATIDRNWQRWQAAPQTVDFKSIHMDIGDGFDVGAILQNFMDRKICFSHEADQANKSINGVTFRILKDYRSTHFRDYRRFVVALDRATNLRGYGKYRFLDPNRVAEVLSVAGELPLFRPYLEVGLPERPDAQSLSKAEFHELLQEAEEIANSL